MIDLIDECGKDLKKFGYQVKRLDKFGMSLASLNVEDEKDRKNVGLEIGEYYIFNSPFIYEFGEENTNYLSSLMAKQLNKVFKHLSVNKNSKILIIGLGNPDIAADRLGKEVFDGIDIDPLKKDNNIYKFCPNIFFSTGIDTLRLVKMFSEELEVDLVILIDALATSNLSRLGTSFQITTSGMTPGSGVNRFGSRICKESVGCECISIGVPFMVHSNSLVEGEVDIILAPKDIRQNVAQAGEVISRAIKEVIK